MFMQEFSRQAATATLVLSPADAGTAPGTATAAGPRTCGLVAKTLVETADGWKPVELLRRGEALQTQDGGLARVLAVDRQILMPATHPLLVHVPGGAFDACSDLLLLPDQLVLLDTLDEMEAARELYASLGFEEVAPYYFNPIAGAHYLKADLLTTPSRY